jgi:uncharacterized damage-inducible protein DinB
MEAPMDEHGLFLKFWKKEAAATRAVIARIPEGSSYRPDPKSRTAREIAWLIVSEEIALADGLEKGRFDWVEAPPPDTMKAILDTYDREHDALTARLGRLAPAQLERDVPFFYQGQEVMKAPGIESAWGFLFDIVHHRGQISTYLRPMGSTVPQIYGPTADEP